VQGGAPAGTAYSEFRGRGHHRAGEGTPVGTLLGPPVKWRRPIHAPLDNGDHRQRPLGRARAHGHRKRSASPWAPGYFQPYRRERVSSQSSWNHGVMSMVRSINGSSLPPALACGRAAVTGLAALRGPASKRSLIGRGLRSHRPFAVQTGTAVAESWRHETAASHENRLTGYIVARITRQIECCSSDVVRLPNAS
jgi:hypothetical protein